MLILGVTGFSAATLVSGASQSLFLFAMMRFIFGLCAAAINAPIY